MDTLLIFKTEMREVALKYRFYRAPVNVQIGWTNSASDTKMCLNLQPTVNLSVTSTID
jgi:hypothetical protein